MQNKTWMRVVKVFSMAFAGLSLAGCSWSHLSSLSPTIGKDTVADNDAVGDASDRILLTNILRAEYFAPLNLSQLSSLSGALSLQGGLSVTLPWGNGRMGSGPNIAQNTGTPSVMGSTSPTYSLTPLNTQAFTLSILQPVSAAYVLNRWQAGMSREMLLRLFVKEVDFPNSVTGASDKFINDPDNDARVEAFDILIDQLIEANAQLKSFDILDPIGPPFSLYAATTASSTVTSPAGTSSKMSPITNADTTGFGQITGSNDGQYHVGNANNKDVLNPDGSPAKVVNGGQLYRVYAGQVELCVEGAQFKNAANRDIPDLDPGKGARLASGLSMTLGASGGPQGGQGAGATGAAAHGAAASPASAGGASQAVTAALQAGRVSALVDVKGCKPDEIVLDLSEETDFREASEKFVHIQWRSVSEIFDYLGAILRWNERHAGALRFNTVRDPSIAPFLSDELHIAQQEVGAAQQELGAAEQKVGVGQEYLDAAHAKLTAARLRLSAVQLKFDAARSTTGAVFFRATTAGPGRLRVDYAGKSYGIRDVNPSKPNEDFSMNILSMLSTLVNLSAQPSVSPSASQPLRLLPIP